MAGRANEMSSTGTIVAQNSSTESPTTPGQAIEQLQVEEPAAADEVEYPTGVQLWINVVAIALVCYLNGLDLAIVAVAVPSLTNQFKTISDIGWYSAVYGVVFSSTNFLFGKMYTVYPWKRVYISSIVLFEAGNLLAALAPTSNAFILGRAFAGLGAAGEGVGALSFIPHSFPNHQRPIITTILTMSQGIGLVSAPIVGGVLIDALSWRACFWVNIPIGATAALLAAIWMKDLTPAEDLNLPTLEKLKRLDPLGTVLIVPSVVCLMIALIWGGTKYSWHDWRIIMLFVLFSVLVVVFGVIQHRQQDKAIVPPRILKNRTVLACSLYTLCCNGILSVTEYYISVYFQGVRGYPASKSGLLGLPMLIGLMVTGFLAAFGTTRIGYYTPFMFATSILAPVASGLLTTVDLDDTPVKVAALLAFVGLGVGFGLQAPMTATMTVIPAKDFPMAIGVLALGSGVGSSLFIAVSATLFQDRLVAEISKHAPGVDASILKQNGLSNIRELLGGDRLKQLLFGYNEAVVQTLYLPLGLGVLTLVGSIFTEIRSVKKKTA